MDCHRPHHFRCILRWSCRCVLFKKSPHRWWYLRICCFWYSSCANFTNVYRYPIHFWREDPWRLLPWSLPNCWKWRYVGISFLRFAVADYAVHQVWFPWRFRIGLALWLWIPWKFLFCLVLNQPKTTDCCLLCWLYDLNRWFQFVRYCNNQIRFGRTTLHRRLVPSTYGLGFLNFDLWRSSRAHVPYWLRNFGVRHPDVQRNYWNSPMRLQPMD